MILQYSKPTYGKFPTGPANRTSQLVMMMMISKIMMKLETQFKQRNYVVQATSSDVLKLSIDN